MLLVANSYFSTHAAEYIETFQRLLSISQNYLLDDPHCLLMF